jgi:hypothetical protein
MPMPFHYGQREVLKLLRPLKVFLNRIAIEKFNRIVACEPVNPHVQKVLLKYNTALYHSHSPIKAALAERLIRTIRLLISRYCTLKNTSAFIHDLDKIMRIYNHRPHRSLSNSSPREVHYSENTFDAFLFSGKSLFSGLG